MDIVRFAVVFGWIVVFGIHRTDGQTLYSAVIHWMPTRKHDQFQFVYHLSWNQQNMSCSTPTCLHAFTTGNFTVQVLGRWPGYMWSCKRGCDKRDVISDMSNLRFTEISSFLDDKWEAGEERITHTFSSTASADIRIGFSDSNGTLLAGLGEAYMSLSIRNDTNRANISPAVALLPIYRVPLGCNITVDLFPFDGDGDVVRCRWADDWTNRLSAANLDGAACRVNIQATPLNGFVAGRLYQGSVYVEDFTRSPVRLTRGQITSVTHGPFSRVPVVFSVHVATAPKNPAQCTQNARFVTNGTGRAPHLYPPPFINKTLSFLAMDPNASWMTVGPRGMLFTNQTGSEMSVVWSVKDGHMTGIEKVCAIAYNVYGVPGEASCETVLVGGTDGCSPNTCTDSPGGTCSNQWQHHTCKYPPKDSDHSDDGATLGLTVGLPVGLFVCLCAVVTGATVYLRRLWLNTHRVSADKSQLET